LAFERPVARGVLKQSIRNELDGGSPIDLADDPDAVHISQANTMITPARTLPA
jgi:hypothetical protein